METKIITPEDIRDLSVRLKTKVKPFYRYTDKAHRMAHINSVMSNVIHISTTVNMSKEIDVTFTMHDVKLAVIAAAYHDIYSTKELRSVHHIKAFNYVLDNKAPLSDYYGVDFDECMTIAYACLEHRGSHKGNYNSPVSELVAAADRGIPSTASINDYMARSYLYARDNLDKSMSDAKFHAIRHIKDKFGVNAYSKVPDWYHVLYKEQLAERTALIEDLDISYFTADIIATLEGSLGK